MDSYNLDALIWELNEANKKATQASDDFNEAVAAITEYEQARAKRDGITSSIIVESIIGSRKQKSTILEDLSSTQKFFSSEVLRISALLQGILAYDELTKRGYHREGL